MKSILLFMDIILLSLFNLLFRYFNVLNDINSFNSNSSVVGGFMTNSSVDVPYFKIFIFSFIVSSILFLSIIFILKTFSNDSFFTIINRIEVHIIFIFTIIATALLYFNSTIAFLVLIAGFIIFLYYIYKEFYFKNFICLLFVIILYFLSFYFISF